MTHQPSFLCASFQGVVVNSQGSLTKHNDGHRRRVTGRSGVWRGLPFLRSLGTFGASVSCAMRDLARRAARYDVECRVWGMLHSIQCTHSYIFVTRPCVSDMTYSTQLVSSHLTYMNMCHVTSVWVKNVNVYKAHVL